MHVWNGSNSHLADVSLLANVRFVLTVRIRRSDVMALFGQWPTGLTVRMIQISLGLNAWQRFYAYDVEHEKVWLRAPVRRSPGRVIFDGRVFVVAPLGSRRKEIARSPGRIASTRTETRRE